MDLDPVSSKRISELEQQVTQVLKTMRRAKLQQYPVYDVIKEFEQQLCEARRNRFDKNNSRYPGY